jgi:ABC-2 type transport system permease protein
MSPLLAVTRREFASFFRTPLGWVVIAAFQALSGLFFIARVLIPGEPATMRSFFGIWWTLLMFIAPAISMRLLSEESRTGTLEPLLTSPVSEAAVVTGKYFAALGFLFTMLLPTLSFAGVLLVISRPDPGPIGAGYLGIALLGMLYVAVGLLASTVTSSQTLAFLLTLAALVLGDAMASLGAGSMPPWLSSVVYAVSPNLRTADFARGVIDVGNVGFFVIASAWFVGLSALVLQSRRWR